MFNTTELQISAFVELLSERCRQTYGALREDYPNIVSWAGRMALEVISQTDALYHNVEHTILVTLVGQEMLRGKHLKEGGVSPDDWLHTMLALICHDIGYVRGVCRQDTATEVATGIEGRTVALPPGSTDAALMPYHVDRGKLFVEERFGSAALSRHLIDVARIKRNIEQTRFPVPADEDPKESTGYPGLVRAADLVGQLCDPGYLRKIPALFYEFHETGINKQLGYETPADLRRNYPQFYWKGVYPFIQEGLRCLSHTQEGKQMKANLYANVFVVEHEAERANL
jgi:hypothetical protein